jgi:hypothetical protein
MPTMQYIIEGIVERFPNRYEVFAVGEHAFRELESAGLPADGDLSKAGFRSAVVSGVPVIWNEGCTGSNVVAIEKDLVKALADKE